MASCAESKVNNGHGLDSGLFKFGHGLGNSGQVWREANVHQNSLGTMVNALLMSAMLTGQSPAGLNFDFPPQIIGQQLADEPELRLTRELREILQYRAWAVAQGWAKGKTHLD